MEKLRLAMTARDDAVGGPWACAQVEVDDPQRTVGLSRSTCDEKSPFG
jgi:hypothetical protein